MIEGSCTSEAQKGFAPCVIRDLARHQGVGGNGEEKSKFVSYYLILPVVCWSFDLHSLVFLAVCLNSFDRTIFFGEIVLLDLEGKGYRKNKG